MNRSDAIGSCRIPISIVGLLAIASLAPAETNEFEDPEPSVAILGQPAPSFAVQDRNRIWQSWTDFRGMRGLVFIFATKETANQLNAVSELTAELAEQGLPTVIIDVSCGPQSCDATANYFGGSSDLPVRRDPKGAVAALYGVSGVPYAVVVDDDLFIRYIGGIGTNEAGTEKFSESVLAIARGETPNITSMEVQGVAAFLPGCGSGVR